MHAERSDVRPSRIIPHLYSRPDARSPHLFRPAFCSGNPLRVQLLRYPDVLFAGYRLPHPLETKLTLKIQVFGMPFRSHRKMVYACKACHTPPVRGQLLRRTSLLADCMYCGEGRERAPFLTCGWWPQTKSSTNPHLALLDAMRDLKNEFKDLDSAFEAAVTTYKDKTNAGAMDY